MSRHAPIIVIELLLVLGGALAFGWWQLRDVKREQAKRAAQKALAAAQGPLTEAPATGSNDPAESASGQAPADARLSTTSEISEGAHKRLGGPQ